jgi:hypothetical protein
MMIGLSRLKRRQSIVLTKKIIKTVQLRCAQSIFVREDKKLPQFTIPAKKYGEFF